MQMIGYGRQNSQVPQKQRGAGGNILDQLENRQRVEQQQQVPEQEEVAQQEK